MGLKVLWHDEMMGSASSPSLKSIQVRGPVGSFCVIKPLVHAVQKYDPSEHCSTTKPSRKSWSTSLPYKHRHPYADQCKIHIMKMHLFSLVVRIGQICIFDGLGSEVPNDRLTVAPQLSTWIYHGLAVHHLLLYCNSGHQCPAV